MASRAQFLTISLSVVLVAGCSDDGNQTTDDTTGTTGTTTGTADTTDTGTTSSTTSEPTTEAPTSTMTPMTSSATTDETTATTTTSETTSTTGEQTTGEELDCVTIEPGPFTPELLGGGWNGSEDLGFDGAGGLALKGGEQVVIAQADLGFEVLADGLPQVYGTRFALGGDLLLALPQQGKLQAVAPDGTITDLADDLDSPNGLYVDPTGRVWLTEFGGSRVIRFDDEWTATTVYEGPMASTANGVVVDAARNLLFFTNYGAGRLLKLELDDVGDAIGEPVEVMAVQGAALDGLVLDKCGNVYAVDQGNSRLYRAILDPDAVIVGEPELLAEFDSNVANAQFGRGGDWDRESLYLAGNPGDLYRLAIGIEGAPIGLP